MVADIRKNQDKGTGLDFLGSGGAPSYHNSSDIFSRENDSRLLDQKNQYRL